MSLRLAPLLAVVLLVVVPAPAAASASAPPNDPKWDLQWWMENVGQKVSFDAPYGIPGSDVGALDAWRWTRGAGAPPLAIIDSGVDFTHPDLAGAAWENPGEIAGNGIDDDANGFVDDVHGWNFFSGTNDVSDPASHGTSVAGVAAARAGDGVGVAGVAPETPVMAVRVEDDEGYANVAAIREGMRYAARHGARVATLSLGFTSGYVGELLQAVAREVPDMLLVAAAGNWGRDNDTSDMPTYPCVIPEPNIVCVGATDPRDAFADWSNYGAATVDLGAPGDHMVVMISAAPASDRPPRYGTGRGTSLAGPMVAGAAQLLLAARPDLTVAELRAALLDTGTAVPGLAGRTVTGRRLDAAAALAAVAGPAPAPPPVTSPPVDPPPAVPPAVDGPAAPTPAPAPGTSGPPAAADPAPPAASAPGPRIAAMPAGKPRATRKPRATGKSRATRKRAATKAARKRRARRSTRRTRRAAHSTGRPTRRR